MKTPHFSASLRQVGLRATAKRESVLQSLAGAKEPLSADELQQRHRQIDLVTIYRMLEDLAKAGLVQSVIWRDGIRRYESSLHAHHHHLVCDNCGDVEDVVVPHDQKIVKLVAARHRFQTRQHSMEFFGLCADCQQLR